MSHYLLYWKPEGVADPNRALHWAASAHLSRVLAGDVLWTVSMPSSGEFELVTRIEVERVTNSEDDVREHLGHDEFLRAEWYALGPREDAQPNQHIPITSVLRQLRFEGDSPVLPDEITPMHFRSMRRISDESVSLLEDAWEQETARLRRPRNPAWQRDELILALDLYLRLGRRVADDNDPEVIALSQLLNSLPIHPVRPDAERFRNPNGVALKLANFRAIEQPGKGMSRGNRLERVVWDEFANDPQRLRAVADAIRVGAASDDVRPELTAAEEQDEEEFPEGRIVYRRHRARERNRALVERKKAQVLAQRGCLTCEACSFDFAAVYGLVGEGFIECHHAVALSELAEERKTRLEDVVLVCSNCHRMIHRRRPWLTAAHVSLVVRKNT